MVLITAWTRETEPITGWNPGPADLSLGLQNGGFLLMQNNSFLELQNGILSTAWNSEVEPTNKWNPS